MNTANTHFAGVCQPTDCRRFTTTGTPPLQSKPSMITSGCAWLSCIVSAPSTGRSEREVQRHEIVDLRYRPAVRDPFESLCESGVRIDIIYLRSLQKPRDGGPGPTASTSTIGA